MTTGYTLNPRLRMLAGAVAAVAVLGACGGDDAPVETVQGITTSTAVTGSTTAAPGAEQGASPGAASPTAPPAGGKTTATTVKAPGSSGSTSGSGAAASATPPTPAAPGRYSYSLQGASGQVTLVVDAATGNDQHSTHTHPTTGTLEQTLRYERDGVKLVNLEQKNPAGTVEFKPAAPVIAFPFPLQVGATWTWSMQSTDGRTTLAATWKAARMETVAIGGEQVSTMAVEAEIELRGAMTATSNQTLWISDAYRIPVKEHEMTDGRVGTFTAHSDTTATLTATKPS